MKTILRGPAALLFLLCSSLFAALPPAFTARELAQGFSDSTVLAQPRDAADATVAGAELREGLSVRQSFPRFGNLRVLNVPAGETVRHAIERLRATGRYAYVEPDRLLHARTTPNDPSFSQQWGLNNTATAGADIGAVTAWNTLTDASSVIVAVVDSGAWLTHTDLAANLWSSTDAGYVGTHGISATGGNGSITNHTPNDTDVGHGTHVSGIIGAVGNNGIGIAGVAWKAQLMPLRYLHGTSGTGSTSDSLACINFAISHGAKIINASYGSSSSSNSELTAIRAARDADIIFVAAAGNDTANSDITNDYPSGYALDNIVSVAATTSTDALASFSNYGSGSVELGAPGQSIYSTVNGSDTAYDTKSGTSMAAPHVSGALALLRARFPSDTYRQAINRLLRNTTKIPALAGKVQTNGRLNLAAAIVSADNRPFNDDFATRAVLVGPNVRARSSNVGATPETGAGEPAHAGFAANHSLWWSWTATDSTQVFFDTAGSDYDTVLAVYTGTALAALTPIASDDDSSTGTTSRIVMNVVAGTTYQIAVDGKNGATGYTALRLGSVPPNDNFASAKTLTGLGIRESATTLNATREGGEPDPTGFAAGLSVWYKWVAPSSVHVSLAAFATTTDTVAAVYTGNSVSNLTTIASNDNNANATNSDALVSFNAVAGTTYYFQIDDSTAYGTTFGGDFILTLTDSLWEFPANDSITSSPAVGSDGTLYFGAGIDPLSSSTTANDTNVYAIDANGTVKWTFATKTIQPDGTGTTPANGIILAAPALAPDGTVYIGADDWSLYALNGGTGEKKWSYAAASSLDSTPALGSDGTVYFRDNLKLYALTSAGALKWSYTLNTTTLGGTYNSPVIGADGTIYVGTTGGALYALTDNGTSASTKWSYTADGDIFTSAAITDDGTIYFGTLKGSFYALTPGATSATKKWSITLPAYNGADNSITSSPALGADGTIYFAAYDHKLYALNPTTGTTKWTYTLGDQVRASSPAVASDGTVFVGTFDGSVYAIGTNGGLVRTYPSAKVVRSSPVIAGHRLYFASTDAKLHAFDIGQTNLASPWPVFHQNAAHVGRAATGAITLNSQSSSKYVVQGTGLTLTISATSTAALSYQWYKGGVAIAGATAATLTVASAGSTDAGTYTVVVSTTTGSLTSSPIVVTVVPPGTLPSTFANISTRAYCGTGNNVTIGGFVVSGTASKRVLIRAVGPSLTAQGIGPSEVLLDPVVEVHDALHGNVVVATNDNSAKSADITSAESRIGATALLATDTTSSELLLNLDPGIYSFVVNGKGGASGIVLLEVYDTDDAGSAARFSNIASRVDCTTGNGVAIGGFVISGTLPKEVLIRAVGPTLTTQGIGNAEVLSDPTIELHDALHGNVVIATNDNWTDNADTIRTTGARVGATPFDAADTTSSALVKTLPPGVYSFIASGKNSGSGIVLVEVYDAD